MSGISTPYPFPFCIVPSTNVGDHTDYPVGVDYDTLFRWYWRVKSWRLSVTGLFTSALADGSTIEMDNQQRTMPSLYASEKSLVCPAYFSGDGVQIEKKSVNTNGCPGPPFSSNTFDSSFIWTDNVILSDNEEITATLTCGLSVFNTIGDIVRFDSGLYYPQVNAGFSISIISMLYGFDGINCLPPTQTDYLQATYNSNSADTVNEITASIEGLTFKMYGPTFLGTGAVSNLDFTVAEYWEYDPGDGGGPIWDSSTGTPLRNPFSVQTWT